MGKVEGLAQLWLAEPAMARGVLVAALTVLKEMREAVVFLVHAEHSSVS